MNQKQQTQQAPTVLENQADAAELSNFLETSIRDGKVPELKKDEPKGEPLKKEPLKKEEPKKDEPKKEPLKTEEPKKEDDELGDDDLEGLSAFTKKSAKAAPKEEPKKDEPKKDEPKKGDITTGDEALDAIIQKVTLSDKVQLATKEAFDVVKKAAALKQESLSKEIETLKKQNEELNSGTAVAAELKKVKEENENLKKYQDDAEKKLTMLDVRNSRQYQDTVKIPLENIGKEVDELATKYTLEPKVLRALINPNTPYDELARVVGEANINEEDKDSLKDYRKQLKNVLATRNKLEEDSKVTRDRMDLEQKQQNQEFIEKRAEILTEAKTLYKDTILSKIGVHFEKLEGDGEEVGAWNKVVDIFHNTLTKVDPGNMTIEQQGMVTAFAAAFPVLAAKVEILQNDKDLLLEKLRKFKKAAPSAGPGGKTPSGGQGTLDTEAPLGEWLAKGIGTK